ncbi:hypothetical protein BJ322DRAFT_1111578 [Thelephora terrestris]|uniref:Uncharacterized protein n=1 Tax=Thelephora terrestris TaxID=56493 RepID=A0A9P6H9X2_9AGAM|nr:hypothetical protein BJ322DRAFT_1111578 [Thelephora terrestris]
MANTSRFMLPTLLMRSLLSASLVLRTALILPLLVLALLVPLTLALLVPLILALDMITLLATLGLILGHYAKAPASPDDDSTDSDTIKFLELRAINEKLMRKIQELEAREKTSLEYEEMFEALRDVVYDTKDDIQKIAGHIAVSSTGEIPGIKTFGIPLNPKKIHYENLKYWPQSAWLAVRRKAKPKDSKAPVLSLFFEDESGEMVSDEVKEEVRGDMTAYWVDMLHEGKVPVHYSGLGLKHREDFRLTMEGKYPWLQLCEGHWKVRQLWVNHYKKTRIAAIIDNDPELKIKFANHPLVPIVVDIITDSEDTQPLKKRARASSKEKVTIVISSDTEIAAPHWGQGVTYPADTL